MHSTGDARQEDQGERRGVGNRMEVRKECKERRKEKDDEKNERSDEPLVTWSIAWTHDFSCVDVASRLQIRHHALVALFHPGPHYICHWNSPPWILYRPSRTNDPPCNYGGGQVPVCAHQSDPSSCKVTFNASRPQSPVLLRKILAALTLIHLIFG
jgi:hypothetical protein